MSLQNIIRDIGDIYRRLFDHQPMLNVECTYFFDQFEGNSSRAAEFDRLLQVSHRLNESVDDSPIDERMKSVEFAKINAQIEAMAANLERTIAKGRKTKHHDDYLNALQQKNDEEWLKFERELQQKREEMNTQTEEHLIEYRKQLERLELSSSRL